MSKPAIRRRLIFPKGNIATPLLTSMSIAKKLAILIGSAVGSVAIVTALFSYSESALIMKERKASVQQAVEATHGLPGHYENQAIAGKITMDEAKRQRHAGAQGFLRQGLHTVAMGAWLGRVCRYR